MNTAIVIWYIGATFTAGWFIYGRYKSEQPYTTGAWFGLIFCAAFLWPFILGGEFHRVLTDGKELSK